MQVVVFLLFDPLGGRFLQSDKHMICFSTECIPPAFVFEKVTLSGWLISPAEHCQLGWYKTTLEKKHSGII